MSSYQASRRLSGASAATFKGKVELHVHLDGSLRPESLFDIAQQRGIKVPVQDATDLRKYCCYHEHGEHSLKRFLDTFNFFIPIIRGDIDAIERVSYEFCQDQASQHIVYSEARYSPHLLATTVAFDGLEKKEYVSEGARLRDEKRTASPDDVVAAICRGLERGCRDTGVMVRSILCTMTNRPDWSMEVVELAAKYRSSGVVAIDMAGMEGFLPMEEHQPAFTRAKELGIHRTVHAGEIGIAENVRTAIEKLSAERIGHGYAIVNDASVYDLVKQRQTHLEACIYSSHLTGALKKLKTDQHPVVRWCADGMNCSLSTDDPGVMQDTLGDEYARAAALGLGEKDLVQMCFNAARSCFLPESEKEQLIRKLTEIHNAKL